MKPLIINEKDDGALNLELGDGRFEKEWNLCGSCASLLECRHSVLNCL